MVQAGARDDSLIQTPYELYEWAKENLKGITTFFCSKCDNAKHEAKLKTRLEKSVTMSGTQKPHAFYSLLFTQQLLVKRYSNCGESKRVNVVKAKSLTLNSLRYVQVCAQRKGL